MPIKLAIMADCSLVRKSFAQLTTAELYSVLKLRTDVFFLEQKIDEEELDNRDLEPTTVHWWIADANGTASYLRVIVDDEPEHRDARHSFGRVVTRPDRRGEGLSSQLIAAVIDEFGHHAMLLHAQVYIAPLYAKFGFEEFGEVYTEAGLPHIGMYRSGSGSGSSGA